MAIVDRVEHLADRERRRGVLPDQAERLLCFGGHRILEPEEVLRLEALAETRRLDWRQPVMRVVQQVDVRAELPAQPIEERRHEREVPLAAPRVLRRQPAFGGLVRQRALRHAVRARQPGNPALRANRHVPGLDVRARPPARCSRRRPPFAWPYTITASRERAAEQLVHGHAERLALDVPERRVDRGDRRHRDRAAPPVRALVQVLPGVFDPARIAADEQRHDVLGRGRRHGQLTPVERRIAETVDAVLGRDLQRDEVPARASRR